MLRAFGHHVAACCELKIELVSMPGCNIVARTWPNNHNIMQHPQLLREKFGNLQIWANNIQHVATHRNTSQHGGQTSATCCAHNVTLQCCDRLAGAWEWSNFSCNIFGCCMMLWSFGQVRATMLHPGMGTSSIMSQQDGQTHATNCAQQCCDRLAGTRNKLRSTMLRYVVLICYDRLAGALQMAPSILWMLIVTMWVCIMTQ